MLTNTSQQLESVILLLIKLESEANIGTMDENPTLSCQTRVSEYKRISNVMTLCVKWLIIDQFSSHTLPEKNTQSHSVNTL